MSARENLIRSVYSKLSQNQMEELVDAFAHELAEEIRDPHPTKSYNPYSDSFEGGAEWAADLIDPEVEK